MATTMNNAQSKAIMESAPYDPPSQFKLIDAPPVVECPPSEKTEIWLVRIQDGGLGPAELRGKQVKMNLKSADETLGCFEDSRGFEYEIMNLHNITGVQPYAFFPKQKSGSLEALSISRQVAIVQYIDPVVLDYSNPNDGISEGPHSSSKQHSSLTDHSVEATPSQQRTSVSMDMTAGGISAIDSLQENEERVLTEKARNSGKKSKREHTKGSQLSQPESPHRSEVSGKGDVTSVKSRKHKKAKSEDTQ